MIAGIKKTPPALNFEYDGDCVGFDHKLITRTDDGLEIEIGFDGLDATHVYLNGHEHDLKTDSIKGLYADVGRGLDSYYMSISEIVNRANCAIEDIVKEVKAEERDEERHINSFGRSRR